MKYPHQRRVNGRRLCDHKRHRPQLQALIDAGLFWLTLTKTKARWWDTKKIPQAECPLCLAPARPTKKRSEPPTVAEEISTMLSYRNDAGDGFAFTDTAALHLDSGNRPRAHRCRAPFTTEEELIAWLRQRFTIMKNYTDRREPKTFRFWLASRWFIVGQLYFLKGWEARDIVSLHPLDFSTVSEVEAIIKRMKVPNRLLAMGNSRREKEQTQ